MALTNQRVVAVETPTIAEKECRLYRDLGWWRSRTPVDDFLDISRTDGDRLAVVSYGSHGPPDRFTYAQLSILVDRLALSLLDIGIGPGVAVAYQLPNWWEVALLYLAVSRVGAVSVPMLTIHRKREVSFVLERTKSPVCFIPETYRGTDYASMLIDIGSAMPSLQHIVLVRPSDEMAGVREGVLTLSELLDGGPPTPEETRHLDALAPSADLLAQIMFTSGTTGEPKGVMHTHNTMYAGIQAVPRLVGLDDADVILMFSPLAHQTGFYYGVVMPFVSGVPVVYLDGWDPSRMLETVDREQVTWTMGTTTFLLDACNATEVANHDLSTLRYFVCGGASIPPYVIDLAAERLRTPVLAVWGMTEVGIATMSRPEDSVEVIASSDGTPMPWVQVRVVDRDGDDVVPGEVGRLLVRSAALHVGYLGREDLYQESFCDGWFDTGDLARSTSEGGIRICGRLKELVIRGGENVPVLEVEQLLVEHPSIQEVAVVGIPHPRLGEQSCAVVTLTANSELNLSDVQEFLQKQGMARQYWPEHLEVRAEFPKTSTGKVQKFELRDDVLRGRRIHMASND